MPSRFGAAPIIFKQPIVPDNTSDYGPTIGDIWVDTSTNPPVTKKCTAVYPFTWTSIEGGGGGGTPGGLSTQLQYNNAGSFGGISTLTTNGTVVTATVGADLLLVDPIDTTKKFNFDASNIVTATQRTVNIPNANSTTIQSNIGSAHNFLTAVSAQGVVSTAQPAFTDISGSLATTQLPAFTGDVSSSAGSNSLTVIGIQAKAIDAPTTLGDIFVYNGTAIKRLGVGPNTQVLTADSTQPTGIKWAAGGGGGSFNPSDRTLYWLYDEFDYLGAGSIGRLNWGCDAAGAGYTTSTTAGPTNSGSAHFDSTGTASHDFRCTLVGIGSSNSFPFGNMSTYTFDAQWSWQASAYSTNQRIYICYAGTRNAGSPADGFCIRYDPTLGTPDTTFHFACYKGSTLTADVDSTITPTANQLTSGEIYSTVAGTIGMQLFDNNGNSLKNTTSVCTSTNVTTASLGPMFNLFQPNAVDVTFDLDRYSHKVTVSR